MNIANTDNIEFETFNKPDTVVNTEKLFGTKCPFSVPAFSKLVRDICPLPVFSR